MNYCFNCGAKLIEKDQKFCIKCGTKLVEHEDKYKDYLKKSHSKYNKREGESYNDYLERINSPLKDKIATEEEIERESEDYINFDPQEDIRKNKINYPKSEREARIIAKSRPRCVAGELSRRSTFSKNMNFGRFSPFSLRIR